MNLFRKRRYESEPVVPRSFGILSHLPISIPTGWPSVRARSTQLKSSVTSSARAFLQSPDHWAMASCSSPSLSFETYLFCSRQWRLAMPGPLPFLFTSSPSFLVLYLTFAYLKGARLHFRPMDHVPYLPHCKLISYTNTSSQPTAFILFFSARRFERAIRKRPNTVRCLAVKSALLGTRHPRKEPHLLILLNLINAVNVPQSAGDSTNDRIYQFSSIRLKLINAAIEMLCFSLHIRHRPGTVCWRRRLRHRSPSLRYLSTPNGV